MVTTIKGSTPLARRSTLNGFENINANNGWAMAVLGASIVFCGLAALSLVISQIHKILNYFEKRSSGPDLADAKPKALPKPKAARTVPRLPEPKELVSVYRPLVEGLNEPFQLALLYEHAAKMQLPHSHLSISRLREAGVLAPQGEGDFIWNNEKADSL